MKGILSTFSFRSTLAATVFATLFGGDWWSAAEQLGTGGTENCYSLANVLRSSQPSDEDPISLTDSWIAKPSPTRYQIAAPILAHRRQTFVKSILGTLNHKS